MDIRIIINERIKREYYSIKVLSMDDFNTTFEIKEEDNWDDTEMLIWDLYELIMEHSIVSFNRLRDKFIIVVRTKYIQFC